MVRQARFKWQLGGGIRLQLVDAGEDLIAKIFPL
jgi:hypothetical protein